MAKSFRVINYGDLAEIQKNLLETVVYPILEFFEDKQIEMSVLLQVQTGLRETEHRFPRLPTSQLISFPEK